MGLAGALAGPPAHYLASLSPGALVASTLAALVLLAVFLNILGQLLLKDPSQPPIVFHWFPLIGSTVTYGIDPYKFFFDCRKKYGDVFTFILLGKKTTVCLGTKGNDFILNGKLQDVNAEEVYSALTTPVFGKDVVYDCPNAKLMEQKKFVKFGLTTQAFETYVPMIERETVDFLSSHHFPASAASGTVDVPPAMSELTIYTASRCLQGREVRERFNSSFADLYHDLDMGFAPVNFMLPWLPLPHNRKRDAAQQKMARVYLDIIEARKAGGSKKDSEDMIWNLMGSVYKDGTPMPDREAAHMMIALLMAGQHSSASTSSWIVLRLAQNPHIADQLLEEQRRVFGDHLPPLTYDRLSQLPLNSQVVKETLRIHAPIHSIMRAVKNPLTIESSGRVFHIPSTHVLLAAPGLTSKVPEFFPEPEVWDPHRWDAGTESSRAPTMPATGGKSDKDELTDYGYGLVSKGTTSPYLPFGAGRHRCIGEQFAYLQLGAIIATMVRHMRFRNVEGDSVANTDYSSLFSQPMRPAKVSWERRSSGNVDTSGKDE